LAKGFKDSDGKFHPMNKYKLISRKKREPFPVTKDGVKVSQRQLIQMQRADVGRRKRGKQFQKDDRVMTTEQPFEDVFIGDKGTVLGFDRSRNFVIVEFDLHKGEKFFVDPRVLTKGTVERKAREVIFQDDPDAIPKLEQKLQDLEKQRAYWKTVKKTVPRDYSATEGDRKWFMPQNINANIRTVKKKLEVIKNRKEKNIGLKRKTTFKNGRKVFYYEEVEPVGKVGK
jgi:hypothetical protein